MASVNPLTVSNFTVLIITLDIPNSVFAHDCLKTIKNISYYYYNIFLEPLHLDLQSSNLYNNFAADARFLRGKELAELYFDQTCF